MTAVPPLALIGFGEAARAFAEGAGWPARGFDIKTSAPATRAAKLADLAAAGIPATETLVTALSGAGAALSLVTADQAGAAARAAAACIAPGTLFLDMNSVSPGTKRADADAIAAAGGRHVDVAIMAPVHPQRRGVPLLVAGPHAGAGAELLRALGFTDVAIAGPDTGAAAAIKMIRSVMVKGLEALSAECVLAASQAGVLDQVIASLDASWPGADWRRRFDYNLDRMLLHGARRAAEMDEVAATLDELGTGSLMARATAQRQRALGGLALPPDGLDAKLATIRTAQP